MSMRPITIGAKFSFEAAHRLPMVPRDHKCGRLHGHNWTVEIELVGVPNEIGWVVDFYDIEHAWREAVYDVVDHRELNAIPGLFNPTTETIARWIGERLQPLLPQLSRIVVSETPAFSATWYAA